MDRSGLTSPVDAPWNPIRCDGTPLPPGWLLAAKLLAFSVFPATSFVAAGPPFLPFFSIFDSPLFAPWLPWTIAIAFHAAFLCLMFNRLVQRACLVMAGCIFLHVASHRLAYANNGLFTGVFLLLIGLHDARTGLWPLRIQLALVYGSASLNKALDRDWWNGQFFDTLMIDALGVRWYQLAAGALPEHFLGRVFGAFAILTEATTCAMVLGTRDGRVGVLLMLFFHVAMLVATWGQLSLAFMYASLAVSAAFLYSPIRVSVLAREELSRLATPAAWGFTALIIRYFPRIRGWL